MEEFLSLATLAFVEKVRESKIDFFSVMVPKLVILNDFSVKYKLKIEITDTMNLF